MDAERTGRRGFLQEVCGGAAIIAGGAAVAGGVARAEGGPRPAETPPAAAPSAAALPTIQLGKHTVTRLIAGGNPLGGYSHSTPDMAQAMREYFTPERSVEFLLSCEREGINTWQFDHFDYAVKALRGAREKGAKIQFICLHHDGRGELRPIIADMDPIAIVHHGQVTDRSFREGKHSLVRDFVKRVRDLGVLAGVSTHSPANLRRMADEGWENDLFMTSFYQVTLPADEQRRLYGRAAVHDPFFEGDPVEMTKAIREVEKHCLSFKVLAAGRKCWSEADVEESIRFAFANIKKKDGVIVGMFPRYRDQVREDAAYARKHGAV